MNIFDKTANFIVDFAYRNDVILAIYREHKTVTYKKVIDVGKRLEVVDFYGYIPKNDSGKFYLEVLEPDSGIGNILKSALSSNTKTKEYIRGIMMGIPQDSSRFGKLGIGNSHLSLKTWRN